LRYFNGSAGGNDVASLAKRVIVIMRHEKRKLPVAVSHLTSPGFVGGKSAPELGLRGGGPHRIITDKAVMGFDAKNHSAALISLHRGGFGGCVGEYRFSSTGAGLNRLDKTAHGRRARLLRDEIDPKSVYLAKPTESERDKCITTSS